MIANIRGNLEIIKFKGKDVSQRMLISGPALGERDICKDKECKLVTPKRKKIKINKANQPTKALSSEG